MSDLQRSTDDSAHMLLSLGSGFKDLNEAAWHGAHHAACWQELPLALSMCRGDVSDRSMYVLRLAGLSPRTGRDLTVFCYQEVGGDSVLSFKSDQGRLLLHGQAGTFPVGAAWSTSDPVGCGVLLSCLCLVWSFSGRPPRLPTARIFVRAPRGLPSLALLGDAQGAPCGRHADR